MVDQRLSTASIGDFATWEPVLRLLLAEQARGQVARPVRVAGRIGRGGWSLALTRRMPPPGRAAQVEDMREELDAVERVQDALAAAGVDDVSFTAEIHPTGKTVLRLLGPSPAVEPGIGTPHPGALILVDGALPEPWRRLPEPAPGAAPAPSADLELLERTLRERLPHAIGATEEEISAAESRLGVTLPDELKALYRVTRARWEDLGDDYEAAMRECEAVGCELFDLDGLYVADAASRDCRWEFAATKAVVTRPDAMVQGLVGSPGWIAFGDNGGGDRLAVDLTPGPRGHTGQVIMLSHEESIGAELVAHSLTDLVLGRLGAEPRPREERPPAVARVNIASLTSIQAAAHPGLEALSIGVWDGAPLSLALVARLPRLRTLTAYPGTLADPLEIAELTELEFLELGPEEWRVLLDAGAVPRSLSAAAIEVHGDRDPLPIVAIANEILALWDRPQIIQTVLEGDLGPLA
ncbi:SMI1/KNR4 family protein [Streptomyces sp. NBC_00335]|uniref:SMI1/KNR4 family protein n=1 Tax=unclassified Streptomyces TaxID=2593676 RepID=UPI0022576864|nr:MULTISPECIES: SMI1/KNR4 family protein [unclassified Streptomyces]MCX5410195.1 SMI1/KNR4 family protein [Streptomyces sp. NBC_00086]